MESIAEDSAAYDEIVSNINMNVTEEEDYGRETLERAEGK